ncbi:hypothetical protein [Mycobacteroides abscessus]|uniref:hypothetical protein n=1 Tax=Mycobacteroides abscessus TaxID=36809 RepID=UPI00210314C7|nr:hypothetical protein [Mycobacteroides abscessus]
MDHILTAEQHVTQLQQDQLRWAETSPEAAAALRAARTRAVLHVAARMNATVDQLHQLRVMMAETWSVPVERRGDVAEAAESWSEANCSGDDEEWEMLSIVWLVEELWPDVVAETDAWARRHASMRV